MPLFLPFILKMKPWLIRLISLAAFLFVGIASDSFSWGFSLARHQLAAPSSFASHGEFPAPLLNQTWTLFAEGGQSYVFISEDETHVLKFFKDQPRPWLQWPSYQAKKNKKLTRTLSGYALIYERCRYLSGIVFFHPQISSSSLPATLIDRLGISHPIDLKSYLFVLQKKAQPLKRPTTLNEKKQLLGDVNHLVNTLNQAHLQDHDPRLHLNLGMSEGRLILIDPGRIVQCNDPQPLPPAKIEELLQ